MKFCPRCGEMLDDNALVCPRCGASQSGQSNLDSINRPTPNQNIQNVSKQHIEISDEKFNKLRKLLILKNLALCLGIFVIAAALIVFLSSLFVFTGKNVCPGEIAPRDPFNFVKLFKYNDTASSVEDAAWNVGPESVTTMMSVVPVVGFFVPLAIGLVGFLMMIPAKKEALYQGYLQKPEGLPKAISNVAIFIPMYVGAILPIIGLIICHSTMNNLSYTYPTGRYYAYGEMALNNSIFTVALVLAIIFAVIVIAGSILYTLLFIKSKVKEVTEN